jgi:RNA polymerase sigma factor (sigma-70 family)
MKPRDVTPELLEKAQRGDRSAQAALLREIGPQVSSLIRRLGHRRDADDQRHDIFLHLLAVLPKYDLHGPAQFSTWVFTVAYRWLLMQQRKPRPVLTALDGGLAETLSAEGADASAYAEGRQLSALLDDALLKLPEEPRRVFVLSQLHHVSMEDIALGENIPVGTVKSRLHRARALLVLHLGPALDRAPSPGGRRATT